MAVTFEFKLKKDWLNVWEALNDSPYHFASYGYKAITVYSATGVKLLREALADANIKYKEI